MKASIIREYGDRSKLIVTEVKKPEPGEGEVLVKIKAAGVNPVDYKIRMGNLKDRMPAEFPLILGWEMAGEIEKTGHGARRFDPGDKVYAYARRPFLGRGTYAEYIALPESYVTKAPANLNFEEAASVPLTGLTAFQSILVAGSLSKGQTLLVLGASGGVGSFAVQFGKITGAKVIAVAGKGRDAFLRSLGADEIIDYSQSDFVEQLKTLLPRGADLVYDCVGGETGKKAYLCVKKGGTLVSIAAREDTELAMKFDVRFRYVFVEPHSRQLDQIREWIEEGKVKVHLEQVFDLDDVAVAHEKIETGHTQGKIVLRIS